MKNSQSFLRKIVLSFRNTFLGATCFLNAKTPIPHRNNLLAPKKNSTQIVISVNFYIRHTKSLVRSAHTQIRESIQFHNFTFSLK